MNKGALTQLLFLFPAKNRPGDFIQRYCLRADFNNKTVLGVALDGLLFLPWDIFLWLYFQSIQNYPLFIFSIAFLSALSSNLNSWFCLWFSL